jgi:isoquinoline 1-oxidoreductase subunit alpha
MTTFTVNQKKYAFDVDPTTPLLWVLREKLQFTGAKFGCGTVAQRAIATPPS